MNLEWKDAAARGDSAVLRDLIDRGVDVNAPDRYGQTALMLAAHGGHLEAARILVRAGADLDRTAKYHLSALMLAIINDRTSVAELLIEAGADTRIKGTGAPGFADKTALDLAQDLGRETICRMLKDR